MVAISRATAEPIRSGQSSPVLARRDAPAEAGGLRRAHGCFIHFVLRASVVAVGIAASAAQAEGLRFDPSVDTRLIESNNVGFNRPEFAQRDEILNVYSQAHFSAKGPSYAVGGTLGLLAVQNFETNTPKHLLPRVQLDLNTEILERTFFLDANAGVISTREDPFGARSDPSVPYDVLGALEYRYALHPRLERELSPELKLLARSDLTWVRSEKPGGAAAVQPDVRYQTSVAQVDRKAVPFGYRLELRRLREINDSTGQVGSTIDSGRAGVSYAFTSDFTGSLTYGQEHNVYASSDDVDPISGVGAVWFPSDRSELRADYERRFFGSAWNLALSHRTPFMAIGLNASRQPISASTILGVVPSDSDVALLLDSILTSRYPNANERASVVRALITSQGLPATTAQPIEIRFRPAQLVQSASLSLGILGARTSLFLNAATSKSQALTRADRTDLALSSGSVRQSNLTIQLSRRASPSVTFNLFLSGEDTKGVGVSGVEQRSRDRSALLGASYAISPRSTFEAGVVRHFLQSNSDEVPSASELREYIGFLHRF